MPRNNERKYRKCERCGRRALHVWIECIGRATSHWMATEHGCPNPAPAVTVGYLQLVIVERAKATNTQGGSNE